MRTVELKRDRHEVAADQTVTGVAACLNVV